MTTHTSPPARTERRDGTHPRDQLLSARETAATLGVSARQLGRMTRRAASDVEARAIVARGYVPRWSVASSPGRVLFRAADIDALLGHGYGTELTATSVPRAARRTTP
ncbi:hypothetical protein EPN42_10145 [bacterium]|nr:MAG: hypothetical protein EPN42_10145 [bacterium]